MKKLLLIILISAFLFFYKLNSIPNGFYVDEAVSAYNSYSILLTHKDEYGKFLPITFRFFGSYTPPLYVYASMLPIKIFGLNIFSARFLSALSGLLSVITTNLILKKLKIKNIIVFTFLFAISPWVIFYSRIGYEVYFAFFLFQLSFYFILKSRFSLSTIFLILSAYTSHPTKYLFFPVYPFFLSLHLKNPKLILKNLTLSFILCLPYLSIINTQAFFSKNNLLITKNLIPRYLAYFSPKSLFFLPDPVAQRSMPELSVFYSWMIIPYLTGLYYLIKNLNKKHYKLILFLYLITPLPAALTPDPFSTQRAIPFFFFVFIIIIFGLQKIIQLNKHSRSLIYLLIFIYSPLILWRNYHVLFPKERAVHWNYGYLQISEYIKNNPDNNFLIDTARLKPIYITHVFNTKLNPHILQSQYNSSFIGNYYNQAKYADLKTLQNIRFSQLNWNKDPCIDQIIITDPISISSSQSIEHQLTLINKIKSPQNNIIYYFYQTKPEQKCP